MGVSVPAHSKEELEALKAANAEGNKSRPASHGEDIKNHSRGKVHMKLEQLTALGIDEEIAKKVQDINDKEIEAAKLPLTNRITALDGERDGIQTQLQSATDSLKAFEGIDPENIQAELKKATDALAAAEKTHAADIAKRDSRAETEKLLSSHKFINDRNNKLVFTIFDTINPMPHPLFHSNRRFQ